MNRHSYARASSREDAGAKRFTARAASKAIAPVHVIHNAGDARFPVVSISKALIAGVKLPKTPFARLIASPFALTVGKDRF